MSRPVVDQSVPAASYDVSGVPASWVEGQTQVFSVTVTNAGSGVWHATGSGKAQLAAHFSRQFGADAASWLSDVRVDLAADVAPGDSVSLQVQLDGVMSARSLEFEMVAADGTRFAQFAEVAVGVAARSFTATYGIASAPLVWLSGQTLTFPVVVTNTGNQV